MDSASYEGSAARVVGRASVRAAVRPGEPVREPGERALRHPGLHLTSVLADCVDPAEVFRLICAYLDNASEACERGDFTKDRDERLALGAGLRLKQQAWRWMVAHT